MPPKEKKTKKKKGSPEKKKANAEMEALAAKEAEQNRVELLRAKLKEQHLREEGYTRINARKVNAEWLQRMRAAKLDELRNEASALAREHDREVDRKDRLIEGLMEELHMADDQHDAAAGAHLRVLDQLLDLQEERMRALHARFALELRSIQEEFESEKAEMNSMHARQKKDAHDVVAALEASYAEAVQEASSAYQLAQDEVKGKCSEEYNVLKLALEHKLEGLEGQIEAQHQAYMASTRQADASYQELARSDGEMRRVITAQTQRLRQLQETLVQWRGHIMHNSREWERQNGALQREKEMMIGHHGALKAALARFRQGQEQRLRQMCVSSAAVLAGLRERLEAAGRILKAAELCRKYELPEDAPSCQPAGASAGRSGGDVQGASGAQQCGNGVAGPCGDVAHPIQAGQAAGGALPGAAGERGGECSRPASCSSGSEGCEGAGVEGTAGLECLAKPELASLFQRLNKVYLDAAALDQQRLRLSTENAALRAVLQKVEEGNTVTQDVLDDPLNTLVVVNSRLQRALKGSPAAKRGAAPAGALVAEGRSSQQGHRTGW